MLLDFSVQVALGDETLTEEEWQTLLHSEEPLVRLRGQWVELDRTRLTEVLAQWQKVQRQAGRDGISFVEGMRLLAGAHIGDSNKDGVVPTNRSGSAGCTWCRGWELVLVWPMTWDLARRCKCWRCSC